MVFVEVVEFLEAVVVDVVEVFRGKVVGLEGSEEVFDAVFHGPGAGISFEDVLYFFEADFVGAFVDAVLDLLVFD